MTNSRSSLSKIQENAVKNMLTTFLFFKTNASRYSGGGPWTLFSWSGSFSSSLHVACPMWASLSWHPQGWVSVAHVRYRPVLAGNLCRTVTGFFLWGLHMFGGHFYIMGANVECRVLSWTGIGWWLWRATWSETGYAPTTSCQLISKSVWIFFSLKNQI